MLIAAAAASTNALTRLGTVPVNFWAALAIAVAGIVAVVMVCRRLAQTNKVVLAVVTGIVLSVIGFSWIYERNEPKWATPVVSALADFFPTKGKVLAHR
jgi:apolipoprotein N-acyltransferase